MIVGDPNVFAIESHIEAAYTNLSLFALGFFVIHIKGHCYGVYENDATMLGCSFGAVEKRINERGKRTAEFLNDIDGKKIAQSFRHALYSESQVDSYLGVSASEFENIFTCDGNDVAWAPDGDAAFDDGSYVFQFDMQEMVRLIAFQFDYETDFGIKTINEVQIESDCYYHVLEQWRDEFLIEWKSREKVSEVPCRNPLYSWLDHDVVDE